MPHGVVLMKRGYGRTHRDFEPVPAADAPLDLGDLAMREALSIEGRVLAADGTPVTRTQVILEGLPAGRVRHPGRISLYGSTEERITDHLGRFRFPDLAPGVFKLRVRREGATPVEKEVKLVDTDRLDVEIRFAGGRELDFLVVDDAGEPLAGVYVAVQHEKGRVNGKTDADGRVTLLVEGRVRRIDPPWPSGGKYLRGEPLTDVPAGQSEFKFVLERASAVSGKLLDSEGKPFVSALVDARRGGERVASASTDGAGRFTLTVPRDGTVDIVLRAVQRDLGNGRVGYDMEPPWRGELKNVSPGSEGLVMQLVPIPADRTLVVRVVDPDGKPVPHAIVDVTPRSTSGRTWPKTDEDGVVRFEGMLARATQVRVQVPRGMVLAAPPVRTLEPNGQTVDLRLRAAVTLAGAVVDGAGKPVARALVTAFDGQAVLASTNTGSDGRFALHIASDLGRSVRIQYGGSGYNWHERDNVDPAAGELTLVLENKR
jgi:protocatechuate 3,4-dioxygenase beta subunit